MKPYYEDDHVTIYHGDALGTLRAMPDASVHCCVTSPPYWGLRDYGCEGQLGMEATPGEYVAAMVEVFREVRRVLRDDATLWLILGDTYAANRSYQAVDKKRGDVGNSRGASVPPSLKPKDLVGIPWRVAFALQADGWYLRSDIIWHKPNPMPESVRDRPTKAHEYLFLLSKCERYRYDADAISEPSITCDPRRPYTSLGAKTLDGRPEWKSGDRRNGEDFTRRNRRSVWSVAPRPFPGAHFAVFPEEIPRLCILAGCPEGGTVLDPFSGAATTAYAARKQCRKAIGIELNEGYCDIAAERLSQGVLGLGGAA